MSKNSLAVDYSKLSSVSYDVVSMAKNIAVSITIDDKQANKTSKYNTQDRLQALSIFAVIGKIRETARYCGLPYDTLLSWTNTEWWTDCINQVQGLNSTLIDARCTNVINKAFDSVEQRLDNGDYAAYDSKNQEVIYKPVSAKDSATIFGIMFDKRQISRALPTSISQSTTTHLIDIKGQFDAMSQPKVIEHDEGN